MLYIDNESLTSNSHTPHISKLTFPFLLIYKDKIEDFSIL